MVVGGSIGVRLRYRGKLGKGVHPLQNLGGLTKGSFLHLSIGNQVLQVAYAQGSELCSCSMRMACSKLPESSLALRCFLPVVSLAVSLSRRLDSVESEGGERVERHDAVFPMCNECGGIARHGRRSFLEKRWKTQ